jgi:hypothetical protein
VEEKKDPGPKEIPDKFAHDPIAREAYLAGWSDCGARIMEAKPEDRVGEDQRITELYRRVGALEGQYRALAGDAADNARVALEVQGMLVDCRKQLVRSE